MRVLMLALSASLAAAGCSPSGSEDAALSEALLKEIEAAPASQRSALEDLVVSTEERTAAFLRFASCLSEDGLEVHSYRLRQFGAQSWEVRSPDEMSEDRSAQIEDDCYAAEYAVVSALYVELNRRSTKEETEFAAKIATCMNEDGIDTTDATSRQQLAGIDPEAYGRCYDLLDP